MHEKLKDLLLKAGLTEPEVMIYLELLKNPSASKWDMVLRTGIEKNKVYRAFDHLCELKMAKKTDDGIEAMSLDNLVSVLDESHFNTRILANKLRDFSSFIKIPQEAVSEFEIADTQEKIVDKYIMMSQVPYGTNLDFGDLEGFVPVLGGLDPVFKFRENRYNQRAKNVAICTTLGPFTSCMMRKQDMSTFKSNIDLLKVDFKGKWVIFSDTNDYVMFNHFSENEEPTSVVIKSKIVADTQRMQFHQFNKNLEKF
ncbi:MAG: helix-turn-helix domain-containing protein [Candidatus Peregrinibacteria bacterium]